MSLNSVHASSLVTRAGNNASSRWISILSDHINFISWIPHRHSLLQTGKKTNLHFSTSLICNRIISRLLVELLYFVLHKIVL